MVPKPQIIGKHEMHSPASLSLLYFLNFPLALLRVLCSWQFAAVHQSSWIDKKNLLVECQINSCSFLFTSSLDPKLILARPHSVSLLGAELLQNTNKYKSLLGKIPGEVSPEFPLICDSQIIKVYLLWRVFVFSRSCWSVLLSCWSAFQSTAEKVWCSSGHS